MTHTRIALTTLALALAFALPGTGMAQTQSAEPSPATTIGKDCPPGIGCVTRRPLPRYVSLKGTEARARRGPGQDHRVDWVYQRPGLPLRVTAEYENWRRVEDPEGAGGWMHYALLSPSRTAMVVQDMAEIRGTADANGTVLARTETGVIVRVQQCSHDWCRVSRDGLRGWLPKTALWGVGADEMFE